MTKQSRRGVIFIVPAVVLDHYSGNASARASHATILAATIRHGAMGTRSASGGCRYGLLDCLDLHAAACRYGLLDCQTV